MNGGLKYILPLGGIGLILLYLSVLKGCHAVSQILVISSTVLVLTNFCGWLLALIETGSILSLSNQPTCIKGNRIHHR